MFPGHGNIFILLCVLEAGVSQTSSLGGTQRAFSLIRYPLRPGNPCGKRPWPCLPRSAVLCSVGAFSTWLCSTSPGPSSLTGETLPRASAPGRARLPPSLGEACVTTTEWWGRVLHVQGDRLKQPLSANVRPGELRRLSWPPAAKWHSHHRARPVGTAR